MNERIVILYNTQKFSITMIDNLKHRKDNRCQFYAVNMRNYDMILEFSWLKKINSNIQWFDCIWIYRKDRTTQTKQLNIQIINVESFAQLVMFAMKKNDETYVALSYQILFIENLKKFASCETARCEILQIKKLNVSKFLRNFAQMFFKMLSNNLNTHD